MNKDDIYYTVIEQDPNIYIEKYLIKSYNSLGDINFNENFLFIIKSSYYKTYTTKFKNDYRCSKLEFINSNGDLVISQNFKDFKLNSIYIEANYLFNIAFDIFAEDNKGFGINTRLYIGSGEISEENVINKTLQFVDELKTYDEYSVLSIKRLVEKEIELNELKVIHEELILKNNNLSDIVQNLNKELISTKEIINRLIKK